MNCPACLTGGLGPAWFAAFAVCILFFLVGALAMVWASRSGRLENMENAKYRMLQDDEG